MGLATLSVVPSLAAASPPAAVARSVEATLQPGAAAALRSSWQRVLSQSVDLGPSAAKSIPVVVDLRSPSSPVLLEQWAHAHHLHATWTAGQGWSSLAGSAQDLEAAFHVRIDNYRDPAGRSFYAARNAPSVPAELRSVVASIGAINSYLRFQDADVPNGGISAVGIIKAYDVSPLTNADFLGQGQTVVFFETDGFTQPDLNQFTNRYNLPPIHLSVVGGQAGKPEGEAELDVEAVHGIAPGAKLVYVNFAKANSEQSLLKLYTTVAKSYPGAIWTTSLGICEGDAGLLGTALQNIDNEYLAAEAKGTTIFTSSGDNGGLDCTPTQDYGDNPQPSFAGVNLFASFPAVVGVGGTTLSVTTSGTYVGETAWTQSVLSQGSSGGISQLWLKPPWQKGLGTGNINSSHLPRQVPDVAALGDMNTGFAANVQGSATEIGGTSLAAPVWAAFMALIDQYLESEHLKAVGFANQDLYEIASGAAFPAFHDITLGGNAVYPATPGYDMVTGLGTPDVWNLARDLVPIQGGP